MNALEKITLEIKAIFLHLLQEELISLELINFSKGHEGPDMGRCVCVCVPDMGQCVCVCVCVCACWRWGGRDRVVSSKIANESCKIKIHYHLIKCL